MSATSGLLRTCVRVRRRSSGAWKEEGCAAVERLQTGKAQLVIEKDLLVGFETVIDRLDGRTVGTSAALFISRLFFLSHAPTMPYSAFRFRSKSGRGSEFGAAVGIGSVADAPAPPLKRKRSSSGSLRQLVRMLSRKRQKVPRNSEHTTPSDVSAAPIAPTDTPSSKRTPVIASRLRRAVNVNRLVGRALRHPSLEEGPKMVQLPADEPIASGDKRRMSSWMNLKMRDGTVRRVKKPPPGLPPTIVQAQPANSM